MTRLAKILVIFTTAASLGFAAFAMAMFAGGPNWSAMTVDPSLSDRVAFSTSETGTHTATLRVTDAQVASGEILPDVVLKSQARILQDIQTELQNLKTRIETLSPQREVVSNQIVADEAGLKRHAEIWNARLADLGTRIAQVTDELAMTGMNAVAMQEQLKELRFEVLRLRNQLELMRNDQYAALQQQEALEAELLLLRENRLRLERRQDGLKQQLSGTTY